MNQHLKPFLLTCAAGSALMTHALAQTNGPLSPRQIDRSVIRPGARAQGLGGTTLFGSGIAATAYNPAALGQNRGVGIGADVVGRTDNVKVDEIVDLIDGIEDLNDAAEDGGFPLDAFNDVFSFARKNSGRPLRASATPSLGLNFSNLGQNRLSVGILAYGEAIADVRADVIETPGARQLNARGALLSMSAIAVPVALRVGIPGKDYGTFGANFKLTRADYLPTSFLADEGSLSVQGSTFDRAKSSKFGLDVGYISPSLLPTLPGRPYDLQAAFAIRNLISPRYNLRARGTQNALGGATTPVVFNGSFKQSAQFDAGLRFSAPLAKTTGYLEVHNVTSKNGGDRSFHVGAEFAASRNFALRGGYDDDQFTAGIGLNLGGARVDLAVGQRPSERFALGLSFGR